MADSIPDKNDEQALRKARSLDSWNLYTSIYDEFFGDRNGTYELSPAALLEFADRLKAQILSVPSAIGAITFHGSGEDLATDVHALLNPAERKRFMTKWQEREGQS